MTDFHANLKNDLDIYIDFKSPAAYLAFQPSLDLRDQYPIKLHWHPVRTRERAMPQQTSDESKGETHARVREQARHKMHLLYAGVQHLTMNFPAQPGETDLALAALLYCGDSPEAFIRHAFAAYWISGANLNDSAVVIGLLESSGLDGNAFNTDHWLEILQQELDKAISAGAIDAPAYLFQEQLFIGREHLPWIRDLAIKS